MRMNKKITEILIQENMVKCEDRELYEYCFDTLFGALLIITVTCGLGFIIGRVIETFLFLGIVIPLRSCAGGFHAKNATQCFGFSVMFYLVSIMLPSYILIASKYLMLMIVACLCLIIFNSPTESINKPLTNQQRTKMKVRTAVVCGLIGILSIILKCFDFSYFIKEIFIILVCVLLSQYAEKLKVRYRNYSQKCI